MRGPICGKRGSFGFAAPLEWPRIDYVSFITEGFFSDYELWSGFASEIIPNVVSNRARSATSAFAELPISGRQGGRTTTEVAARQMASARP